MNIVARQGMKYSIIGYLGFLLGTFSNIFIFPNDMAFYGKIRYVLPMVEMLLPLVVFGLSYSNIKFYNQVHQEGKHQNMLSLTLGAVTVNFSIFILGFFALSVLFPQLKTLKLWEMRGIILPLILVMALSSVFNKYLSNYKRIAIPNIFDNLFPKIANILAFCAFFYFGLSEQWAFSLFFSVFMLAFFGYIAYANSLERLHLDFSTDYFRKDGLWKAFLNYGFFCFLGNIGNYIAMRIDNVMISEFIGFEYNGVYSTVFTIIMLVNIPQMGVNNISAPIINQSIINRDFEGLDKFHKKTSLSLFALGMVGFSCILIGFPYLTELMKNGALLRQAEPVIWILGVAMVFDLATGFNNQIISMSQYYRFNIVIILILAGLNVLLNYLFLTQTDWGIYGVAMATAISLTVFNAIKIVFNYAKFRVFPLTIEMLYVVVLCSLSITVVLLLPDFSNALVNLFYKPAVLLMFLLLGNHFLKIYPIPYDKLKKLLRK